MALYNEGDNTSVIFLVSTTYSQKNKLSIDNDNHLTVY